MTAISKAIIKGLKIGRQTAKTKEEKDTFTFFIENIDKVIELTLRLGRKPTIQEVKDATDFKMVEEYKK